MASGRARKKRCRQGSNQNRVAGNAPWLNGGKLRTNKLLAKGFPPEVTRRTNGDTSLPIDPIGYFRYLYPCLQGYLSESTLESKGIKQPRTLWIPENIRSNVRERLKGYLRAYLRRIDGRIPPVLLAKAENAVYAWRERAEGAINGWYPVPWYDRGEPLKLPDSVEYTGPNTPSR